MTHLNLVATELDQLGFKVEIFNDSAEVSLDNRKVNSMEIRQGLEQVFEDIDFELQSTSKGILVTV